MSLKYPAWASVSVFVMFVAGFFLNATALMWIWNENRHGWMAPMGLQLACTIVIGAKLFVQIPAIKDDDIVRTVKKRESDSGETLAYVFANALRSLVFPATIWGAAATVKWLF